jgi:hypothetical protein
MNLLKIQFFIRIGYMTVPVNTEESNSENIAMTVPVNTEKIAMTAPVNTQEETSSGAYKT